MKARKTGTARQNDPNAEANLDFQSQIRNQYAYDPGGIYDGGK
jgi:hypothetical protein